MKMLARTNFVCVIIGEYTADLLVEQSVLVELKVVGTLDDIHRAQCLNYFESDWSARVPAVELREASARSEAPHALMW